MAKRDYELEIEQLLAEALWRVAPTVAVPACLYDMMEERRTNPPIKIRLKAEVVD